MLLSLDFSIRVVERFPLGDHLQLPEGDVFFFLMSVLGACLSFWTVQRYFQNFIYFFRLLGPVSSHTDILQQPL